MTDLRAKELAPLRWRLWLNKTFISKEGHIYLDRPSKLRTYSIMVS